VKSVFLKYGIIIRNPKQKSAKRELEKTGGTSKRNRLGQVGVHERCGTGAGGSP